MLPLYCSCFQIGLVNKVLFEDNQEEELCEELVNCVGFIVSLLSHKKDKTWKTKA